MQNYYAEKLNSNKLFAVYQTDLQRVRQYLVEEINYIKNKLKGNERVLEIGCGYGRIIKELSSGAGAIVGIDISPDTISLGEEYLKDVSNCELLVMDAYNLPFKEEFDVVICLQNGISAIKGLQELLIEQCHKALKKGGKAFFSTYSEKFWEHRLAWFYEQAEKGLLGEIDEENTKDGVIVCKDGFSSRSFSKEELAKFGETTGCKYYIEEIDESSLFLIFENQK